jgi:hypothetical protein
VQNVSYVTAQAFLYAFSQVETSVKIKAAYVRSLVDEVMFC